MSKHTGTIMAWIIVAGISLYMVQHYRDIVAGLQAADELTQSMHINDMVDQLFK